MRPQRAKRFVRWAVAAGVIGASLAVAPGTQADQADLAAGLAYLRAGAQVEAEVAFARYVGTERDSDVRRSVVRVLPLLKQPLSGDVREYLASTIEGQAGFAPAAQIASRRPSYWSRIFPVFP